MRNVLLNFSFLLVTFCATSAETWAQGWRVGVTAGADCNTYTMDMQYMNDFRTKSRWGGTVGVSGQYNFTDWFGVRADLNWTQKNYRKYRTALSQVDYKYRNNYLQLPVMASFSFGGEKLRGFANLGIYGGYWMNSSRWGTDYSSFGHKTYEFSEKQEFNSDRDRRVEFGFVGGAGLEYRLCKHWAAQIELRYYYSTTSVQKQYMRVADYRYNGTTAIQMGWYYIF